MKIIIATDKPNLLFNEINKKIKKEELKTWEIKKNNKDEILYSHSPEQWKEKSMLKPIVYDDRIEFISAWWSKDTEPDSSTKGYILGRFVEILIVHFHQHFENMIIE